MRQPQSFLFALGLVVVVSSSTGCGGSVGTERRPAPDPMSPSSTSALTFSGEDLESSLAACTSPHGSVESYTTVDQLVALLSRHWIYCPGDGRLPSRANLERIGLEFTDDGHVYWLSEDSQKGISRLTGIDDAAAYEISPPMSAEYNDVSFQIDVIYADRSVMGTYATFEAAPRRLKLTAFDGYFISLKKVAAVTARAAPIVGSSESLASSSVIERRRRRSKKD